MGHPCRIERDILKYSLRNPFVSIDAFAFLKIILIQDWNLVPKLNFSKHLSVQSHSTRSKAFV